MDSTMPWNLSGYPKDEERWRGWQRERHELWQTMAECLSPEVSVGSVVSVLCLLYRLSPEVTIVTVVSEVKVLISLTLLTLLTLLLYRLYRLSPKAIAAVHTDTIGLHEVAVVAAAAAWSSSSMQ